MCVCKCTVLKGVSKCVSAPPPQSCAQHALAMRIVGNKAGVQESSSHSRCTVKRGGSGVASCSAESPGQPRPGPMRTLSLADGRWKEREPCARGGVQACVQRRQITTDHGSPLQLVEYVFELMFMLYACSNIAEVIAIFPTTLTADDQIIFYLVNIKLGVLIFGPKTIFQ